ncbi:hypothetical protein ACF0H5_006431 [Mactra antiquata]
MGFSVCELWGYFSTTITMFFSWILTIAMIERYVALLMPADLLTTFTARNIRIIAIGLLTLIMVASTGPFYGFGEYSFLRGSLNVLVSTNISLPSILPREIHPERKLENIHQLFSHLRQSSEVSPQTNLLRVISHYLQSQYDVIVSESKWLPHGILFNIRTLSSVSLNTFTSHCNDKIFASNMTELSFLEDIARNLNISDTEITVQISDVEQNIYKNAHLQAQEIGLCSADLTAPAHHSTIWTGYYLSIIFILPYCTSLVGLCLIYVRGFGVNPIAVKQASDTDVSSTNVISSYCTTTCIVYMLLYATTLASADGQALSSNVLLITNYLASLKTLYLVIILRLNSCACACYCTCCYNCFRRLKRWNTADGLAFELEDIEERRSLTRGRRKSNILS